ncbi:MAG: protein phosphatase 2C domain-containing protein [Pseudomonadota bacterium]
MQTVTAAVSLIGHREDNQDAVDVFGNEHATLLAVVDGMGGHSDGALAAQLACQTLRDAFGAVDMPIPDPRAFLRDSIVDAHSAIAGLGVGQPLEDRPRATCAVCLMQGDRAYWCHLGDSRIYLLRNQAVQRRTRDHSHVEVLLQEGLITEDQMATHPLRNFVEICLGGEAEAPAVEVSPAVNLMPGDLMLLCSDGFWSGLAEADITAALDASGDDFDLETALRDIAEAAVEANAPAADNTTAAAIHWRSEE